MATAYIDDADRQPFGAWLVKQTGARGFVAEAASLAGVQLPPLENVDSAFDELSSSVTKKFGELVPAQVEAFIAFVRADRRLLSAIRNRSWSEFARIYNGPSYRKYKYDEKMRTNYQKYAAQ